MNKIQITLLAFSLILFGVGCNGIEREVNRNKKTQKGKEQKISDQKNNYSPDAKNRNKSNKSSDKNLSPLAKILTNQSQTGILIPKTFGYSRSGTFSTPTKKSFFDINRTTEFVYLPFLMYSGIYQTGKDNKTLKLPLKILHSIIANKQNNKLAYTTVSSSQNIYTFLKENKELPNDFDYNVFVYNLNTLKKTNITEQLPTSSLIYGDNGRDNFFSTTVNSFSKHGRILTFLSRSTLSSKKLLYDLKRERLICPNSFEKKNKECNFSDFLTYSNDKYLVFGKKCNTPSAPVAPPPICDDFRQIVVKNLDTSETRILKKLDGENNHENAPYKSYHLEKVKNGELILTEEVFESSNENKDLFQIVETSTIKVKLPNF